MAASPRNVQGLADAYSLFDNLPSAAEQELGVEMVAIGREVLAAQKADVAKETGPGGRAVAPGNPLAAEGANWSAQRGARGLQFNGRVRRAIQGGPFYGRFVEFGRRAQTVLVTRRIRAANRRLAGNNRKGNNRRLLFTGDKARLRRRGPNKGTPVGSAYKIRVKAMAARPFVAQPLLADVADAHLSDSGPRPWSAWGLAHDRTARPSHRRAGRHRKAVARSASRRSARNGSAFAEAGHHPPFHLVGDMDSDNIGGKDEQFEQINVDVHTVYKGADRRELLGLMHTVRIAIDGKS